MGFNPLGNFNPNAPVSDVVIAAAKTFRATLPSIPDGLISRLYLHWSVAGLCAEFPDYNAEKEFVDGQHILKITHDPRDNAPGLNNNQMASHTWHRNTGALGIAITGMDGANVHNFGPDPVTVAGLEYLCAGAAALCLQYGLDANGTVLTGSTHLDNNGNTVNTAGEPIILTHAECAVLDAYPTERWDLGSLCPLPDGVDLTPEMRTQCGNALRQRVHTLKLALAA
jgi:hypothetical protein